MKLTLYSIKRFPIRFYRHMYLIKLKWIDAWNKTEFYSYDSQVDSPNSNGFDNNKIFRSTPSGFWHLKKLIDRNSWMNKANIIDIGCGKGSAMNLFCDLGFSKVAGIEINKHIFEICLNNFKSISKDISLFNVNALEFQKYNDFDTYYFYNPFPCEVFKDVLNLIVTNNVNKEITIIYANNVCDELLTSNDFVIKDKIVDLWGNYIAIYVNYDI